MLFKIGYSYPMPTPKFPNAIVKGVQEIEAQKGADAIDALIASMSEAVQKTISIDHITPLGK